MTQDLSYRALARQRGFGYLLLMCGGVWLFAADRLMESTLLPDILADLGGANLIGWGRTLFEAATIMTGMLSPFLVRSYGVRSAFAGAALLFGFGCAVSFFAQDMVVFQIGRLVQGFAGSAFVSLASIGVARMFPRAMIARAGSVVAIVWGFAAFSGPLIGGIFSRYADWRAAFLYLVIFAAILAAVSFVLLGRHHELTKPIHSDKGDVFPLVRMIYLLVGISLIATASVEISLIQTPALLLAGLVCLYLFMNRDGKQADRRLLPVRAFDFRTRVGSANWLIVLQSGAVIGISTFAPVLMVALYGLEPIVIGFIMFATALGWTLAEVVFSGTPPEREGRVILWGPILITLSIFVFLSALWLSQFMLWALAFCINGVGFGMAWALISRRAIGPETGSERDRIAGAPHTLQRVGFALAISVMGIIANGSGFSENMSEGTAFVISNLLLVASLPIGIGAIVAAILFVQPRHDTPSEQEVEPLPVEAGALAHGTQAHQN